MTRAHLVGLFCLVAVPACAQDTGTCGAEGFQGLVGQSGEIARLLELEQPARVIASDDMVTADYRPDRINFDLDEDDRIVEVRCG